MKVLVTGGAGFIGLNLIKFFLNKKNIQILNVDKLNYASNKNYIKQFLIFENYKFVKLDISKKKQFQELVFNYQPNLIFHLAAESHVDNSIYKPDIFIKSNIYGTFSVLDSSLKYWDKLIANEKKDFKLIHISTDEVFGEVFGKSKFNESTPYNPSSPYSASKASSNHLVQSWYKTYGLPVIITNCSNNYGPFQNREKLIPKIIENLFLKKVSPIYGNGKNVRDWIYVEDHIRALNLVAKNGSLGETYNIGSNNEFSNLEIFEIIYKIVNEKFYDGKLIPKNKLFKFVKDRPGHDFRYAINNYKIKSKINWRPKYLFLKGLEKTISWYYLNYFKK